VIADAVGHVAKEALRLAHGRGVDVVHDGSGPVTFRRLLDAVGRAGTLCRCGAVRCGAQELMRLPRSIKIGYVVCADHISTPDSLRKYPALLFEWLLKGN
jgi:NADPH:quinone reductase